MALDRGELTLNWKDAQEMLVDCGPTHIADFSLLLDFMRDPRYSTRRSPPKVKKAKPQYPEQR